METRVRHGPHAKGLARRVHVKAQVSRPDAAHRDDRLMIPHANAATAPRHTSGKTYFANLR